METTSLRIYGGVAGVDRQAERRATFLEAGLELLGAPDGDGALSVRGVCRQAGLAARYFYESFADRDTLISAVYDDVARRIAELVFAAVRSASGAEAKVRAGLSVLVRHIAADPRLGRLLFSPALGGTVVAQRRVESTKHFVRLLGLEAKEFYGVRGGVDDVELDFRAEMVVGGLSQVLTSWLAGGLPLREVDVVDRCGVVVLAIAASWPRARSMEPGGRD